MARFRFRAQVALDLRQKQDDEAQRALGEARRAVRQAQSALDRERTLLAEAMARARGEEAHACDTARAVWHRNWVRRQQLLIAAAARALEERQAAERLAVGRAMETRRKLRALERLKDRLWKAYLAGELRAEQKELDALGGLRYVARRGVPEGA